MQSCFEFLVSVINHYYINGVLLIWDSFEWFCLQIRSDTKYFPLLSKALWSRINSCYMVFLNLKQKHDIIIRVISSHMVPMYIKTTYI